MGKIHRIVTGWFRPNAGKKSKRPHSKIEMCCQECGNTFFATNMGRICKACQSSQVIPVGRWLPVRDRRPKEQYGYVL